MQHLRSSAFLCLLALSLLLGSTPGLAQAQGQMFVDSAAWNAAIMGTVVDDDFNSLVNVNGDLITDDPEGLQTLANPQQLAWGQISSTASLESNSFSANLNDEVAIFSIEETVTLDLDPTLGPLEGFFAFAFNQDIRLSLYDGDTLVETLDEPDFYISPEDRFLHRFGWINTEGLNVTRIEITAIIPGVFSIADLDLAFTPVVEPPAPPAEILIPMLVEDIDVLIESNDIGQGEGNPIQNFLQQALKDIEKGKISKAIGKLDDANERVLDLIEDGSLSPEEGQALLDAIDSAILDLLDV